MGILGAVHDKLTIAFAEELVLVIVRIRRDLICCPTSTGVGREKNPLGLLMLDAIHPDPEWALGAYEGLRYLARSRAGHPQVPADHWALIAILFLILPGLLLEKA